MTVSVLDILVAARKLIEKPWHFSHAYDSESGPDGRRIGAFEAVRRAASDKHPENWDAFEMALRALHEQTDGLPIGLYGRENSHSDVMLTFDRAIEAQRAKQGASQ